VPRAFRGEVWLVDLEPVRGHEQGRKRPALVVSTDAFNHGRAQLVVVVPMTTTDRRVPLHIAIDPPEGGVRERSYAMCEAVRSISTDRLVTSWGVVQPATMAQVEDRLRILLEL
jgi:mRNA interferase MazF